MNVIYCESYFCALHEKRNIVVLAYLYNVKLSLQRGKWTFKLSILLIRDCNIKAIT